MAFLEEEKEHSEWLRHRDDCLVKPCWAHSSEGNLGFYKDENSELKFVKNGEPIAKIEVKLPETSGLGFNEACQTFCMQPLSETFAGYQQIANRFSNIEKPLGETSLSNTQQKLIKVLGGVLKNISDTATIWGIDLAEVAVRSLEQMESERKETQ